MHIGFVYKYGEVRHHVLKATGDARWPYRPACGTRVDLAALEDREGDASVVDCARCKKSHLPASRS